MTDAEALKAIGANIKRLRKAAGFRSASAFAEKAGISPARYSEYEYGRNDMPLSAAVAIAEAIGCTLDELIGREVMCSVADEYGNRSEIQRLYDEADERGRENILNTARHESAREAEVVQIDIGEEEQPQRKQA